jgi:alkylation response protein AidB-like acyl-CoA dehydrogenase
MAEYSAPLRDMKFVINELAGLPEIALLPGLQEASPDLVDHVLEEAGRFASGALSPLNWSGDQQGCKLEDGVVTTAQGFKDMYQEFVKAGWPGLAATPDFGGQGLPHVVSGVVSEMWNSANMSFCLCPMLTTGVVNAVLRHGAPEQQKLYLEKLVSGTWTGTMNLTEPQAGSDLSAVRARAVPEGDHYRVFGTKIFITWGEHDMADNIVHLVLARTPDAPEGVKGISLFIVPKLLVNADGSLGERNDVKCVSIEHKLGIHASPTSVLAYGDNGGATGYLIGQENRGLEYMFIMMNLARFSVGLEGVGISERAYQHALAYARERVQGKPVGMTSAAKTAPAAIIEHPDVRRMLLAMKSQIEAMRALAYVTAAALDNAHAHPDAAVRQKQQAFVELMIPIVKGWSTENAQEIASLGVQVHGGMGFIEEAGAAQYYRDVRIITIYEGTTGIQANDLIGRKTARDGGKTSALVIGEIRALDAPLAAQAGSEFHAIRTQLAAATDALAAAVEWMVRSYGSDVRAAHAASVPFLKLWGLTAGGWQMARAALVAAERLAQGQGDARFYRGKIATARFYADYYLPQTAALKHAVVCAGESVLVLADDQF